MRIIDADALEEEFKKEFDQVRTMDIPKGEEQYWDGYEDGICTGWVMVSEDGHFVPSIDIVLCKECKWRGEQTESGIPYYWCRLVGVGYEVPIEHYCSYGEREGE